jgi:citrate lyase beta subunit
MLTALSTIVIAARACGLSCLDGVSLEVPKAALQRNAKAGSVHDVEVESRGQTGGAQLEAECVHGRALGFDGKSLIHPAQIATTNAAFGYSPAAVAYAHRVLEAWATKGDDKGVAVLEGRLIEYLHVKEAQRVLAMDSAIRGRQLVQA